MTQKDKELLFKDLCARLPYGVKCKDWTYDEDDEPIDTIRTLGIMNSENKCYQYRRIYAEHDISRIKPYLRSLSSMTEKEKKEYYTIEHACYKQTDWLNAHHFDYRNLIKMGLALEAPKGMYKTE